MLPNGPAAVDVDVIIHAPQPVRGKAKCPCGSSSGVIALRFVGGDTEGDEVRACSGEQPHTIRPVDDPGR